MGEVPTNSENIKKIIGTSERAGEEPVSSTGENKREPCSGKRNGSSTYRSLGILVPLSQQAVHSLSTAHDILNHV